VLDPNTFIDSYTAADRRWIAFESNGKVGSELRDANLDFRSAIAKIIIVSPERASDELIRNLYDFETSYSKASFAVNHAFVSCLATQLLLRGGKPNITCFLACVFRGQEAYLSSQCVKLPADKRELAVATIDELIDAAGDDVPPYYSRVRTNISSAPAS